MVPNIRRGQDTFGVMKYLYGKERHSGSPHVDPHLVASWDGYAPDPGRDPAATIRSLAAELDLRVKQMGSLKPKKHVWHCSVRTDPSDRHLSDQEWAQAARRVVAAAGLAREDDPDSCRWVAVRHADDHIHIVATTVRGNLRGARLDKDAVRVQTECRSIERDLGLRQLKKGDRTATARPKQAEIHKAERRGLAEPTRDTLKDAVRQAVVGARTDEEFFANLRAAGIRVKPRLFESGDLQGYSVAVPGDRNKEDEPVWYSGTTLGYPLGRVRQRMAATDADGDTPKETTAPPSQTGHPRAGGSKAFRARRAAVPAAEHVVDVLLDGDDQGAAGQLDALGEVLGAMAQTALPNTASRTEMLAAARSYERASRSHIHAARRDTWATRSAARSILTGGYAVDREDGAAAVELVSVLFAVLVVAANWHAARGHEQQAEAARATAQHLRQVYRSTAKRPLEALARRGRAVPAPQRERYARAVRLALPDAAQLTAEQDWDALAATLAEAEAAGHDPGALLEKARGRRELETADSIAAVMVWRVRRLADLPPITSTKARKAKPPVPSRPIPTTAPTDSSRHRSR